MAPPADIGPIDGMADVGLLIGLDVSKSMIGGAGCDIVSWWLVFALDYSSPKNYADGEFSTLTSS